MARLNVLVTGVGGGGVGNQVMKALRMAETYYRIIGTDMSSISKGLYEVDRGYVVPPAHDESYVDRILEICTKEDIRALACGSEQELSKISDNRERFKGILLLINTPEAIRICMDKWDTYLFLKRNGFDTPKSVLPKVDMIGCWVIQALKCPVIVKPSRSSFGSSNVFLAQDKEEIDFFVKYIGRQGFIPMVQEYVGDCDNEYTVGVLTDIDDGRLIGSIAIKRHIMSGLSNRIKIKNKYSPEHGDILAVSSGISQGRVDDYPDVRMVCEKVALALGSKGAMNIQCRKVGDKVFPFEINPRFSGTTSLRAMVGYNEPDILIRRSILKENIQSVSYKHGIIVRGLSEKYIAPLD